MFVAALVGCAFAEESPGRLLADFSTTSLAWTTVNDNVMGGRSEGGFTVADGTLVFAGATNTDGGGFSSIRSKPRALGLEGLSAIRLRVRGDGRTYTFRLATGERAYWAEFATTKGKWREVRLPFDAFVPRFRGARLDLPPVDPADVASVGLMVYDKRDGPFRLEVDWIRAVPPFSLDRFEWKRRLLVVCAAAGDDTRLAKQLDAVRAARAGFDERDMELVVVAPGFGLSASEREALRERLSVGAGSFAVLLVGKDGGVKRRADEPVAMKDIYGQIDGMPMRRAEMRERAK
jgi:hypothetical protein